MFNLQKMQNKVGAAMYEEGAFYMFVLRGAIVS